MNHEGESGIAKRPGRPDLTPRARQNIIETAYETNLGGLDRVRGGLEAQTQHEKAFVSTIMVDSRIAKKDLAKWIADHAYENEVNRNIIPFSNEE